MVPCWLLAAHMDGWSTWSRAGADRGWCNVRSNSYTIHWPHQNWFSVPDKEGCGLMNEDIIGAALMSDGQNNS